MAEHEISIVIFYNKDKVVLRQGKIHSAPSTYDFWGDRLKTGETPLQAIKRILELELNYRPGNLKYWTDYEFTLKTPGPREGDHYLMHLFVSPITPNLLFSQIKEDVKLVVFSLKELLSHPELDYVARDILHLFKRQYNAKNSPQIG
ncbi:NUDIX hydrolase [Candidatus Shapirobacteria bacterium]|nr:NUDIX hydrolase [Candidatus Shapirobacteria bacterium]